MKYIYFVLLFFLNILCGCNNKATSLLKTSNLESSFISIDADSTYSLKTGKGAFITIEAGTFSTKNKVDIEIKEAYSMQDILLAGLTTQSNGRPLQSGGMIFFKASSEGKELEFNKPVKISIPSDMYDPEMQLFKGELEKDSSINWIDPQPLDTTPNAQIILKGEALFKANCTSCHKVTKDFTGPALAGIKSRIPNKQWLYDFVRNPAKMIKTDVYANRLFKKWGPTLMTPFPSLQNEQIDAIYAFVENESKSSELIDEYLPEKVPVSDSSYSYDSYPCGYDTVIFPEKNISTDITVITPEYNNDKIDNSALDFSKDSIENITNDFSVNEGIYEFEISENGWYNIDILLNEQLLTDVEINVTVNSSAELQLNAYLFLPQKKILLLGSLLNDNTIKFDYEDKNGFIKLEKGVNAVLLVVGSDKNDLYYAIESFTIKSKHDLILVPKKTTESSLLGFIKENKIEDIKLDIFKKESLIKPKSCDEMLPQPGTTFQ